MIKETWKKHMCRLATLLVAVAVAGCGGGGTGGAGHTGGTGDYTVEQRSAATGNIAQRYEELAAANDPQAWEKLRDYVLTLPEFSDVGLGDDVLWARFTDGRYFLYLDNWKKVSPDATALQSGKASDDSTTRIAFGADARLSSSSEPAPRYGAMAAATGGAEVPASDKAVFLKLNHSDFDLGIETIRKAAEALTNRGWKVSPERELNLEVLKGIGDAGMLYMNSHSAAYLRDDQWVFAVVTESVSTGDNEDRYEADLDDGSIIYTRTRHFWQDYGFGKLPHYAFTSKFVDKYMKLAPNSLVVLMMCNGASAHTEAFHSSLQGKNAGSIIGWNGNASDLAFSTIDILFDRLTGANAVKKQAIPNRAFEFDDVWAYMGTNGFLVTPTPDQPAFVKRIGSNFSMLNPIIKELQTTGKDKLIIHGEFGKTPGTVTVGGKQLAPKWSADGKTVEVDLGPDSFGEVVVTARGRTSNPRVLGSWRGQVIYIQESLQLAEPGEIFSNTAVVDLHLRADAHAMRAEVDGELINNRRLISPASDTKATWNADGQSFLPDGTLALRWSGNGNFTFDHDIDPLSPYPPADPMALSNVLQARIDAVDGRFQLAGIFGRDIYHARAPAPYQPRRITFSWELSGFTNDGPDYIHLLPWGTFLPFGSDLNVGGTQHQQSDPSLENRLTVKWGAMTVSPAFDNSIGR
jgi:hypothetical protein